MTDEASVVRDERMDEIFAHLRRQDDDIAAIRTDMAFLVEINRNLKGFSEFVRRWGCRINRVCKWTATVAAPIITIYVLCKDSIDALFKRWFG